MKNEKRKMVIQPKIKEKKKFYKLLKKKEKRK